MLYRLGPDIKNYDWGSSGQLSEFLGLSSSGLPEAEAWFGSHPLSGTTVRAGGSVLSFNDWLLSRRSSFDLLVKVLSASRALSIQVHPNEQDAQRGYARENLDAISPHSPERVFKDPRPKPELIVALSPDFRALVGFVEGATLVERLGALVSWSALPSFIGEWGHSHQHPRAFIERVLANGPEVVQASLALSEWISAGPDWSRLGALGMDAQTLEKVHNGHPADSGLLLAIAMHHVRLDVGNGLFVAPGVAHAYVEGFGLELMLPSDNVLRAGLTTKARHPEGFVQIATLVGTQAPDIVVPRTAGGISQYVKPSMPFELRKVEGQAGQLILTQDSLIVVEKGHLMVGPANDLEKVTRGEVVFAEASDMVRADEPTARAWVATSQSGRAT